MRQNIEVTCFKGANEKALDILNKGVTSLGFIIKGSDVNAENIATLLDGICPSLFREHKGIHREETR